MHRQQIATKSVDLTWIFTQSLFAALNIILWSIFYAQVQKEHSKEELQTLLRTSHEGIYLAAERWPGVKSALALYGHLGAACLKIYDSETDSFRLVRSSSNQSLHEDPETFSTYPQPSSNSIIAVSTSSDHDSDRSIPTSVMLQANHMPLGNVNNSLSLLEHILPRSGISDVGRSDTTWPSLSTTPFGLNETHNHFSWNLPDLQLWTAPVQQSPEHNLGVIGDQYLQYFQLPYVPDQSTRRLSQEEQIELMNNLETDGLYGRTQEAPNEPSNYFPDLWYGG